MRAVDTNVVVRLMVRDDAQQVDAAEAFIERGAWISVIALTEAMWVLSSVYNRSSADIEQFVEMLLHHEHFTLQHPEVVRAALDVFRGRPSLGFTDCVLLELARAAGHLPLGTFDRSLAKVDGTQRL
jgi:predicted nucleic-acid-binding protein